MVEQIPMRDFSFILLGTLIWLTDGAWGKALHDPWQNTNLSREFLPYYINNKRCNGNFRLQLACRAALEELVVESRSSIEMSEPRPRIVASSLPRPADAKTIWPLTKLASLASGPSSPPNTPRANQLEIRVSATVDQRRVWSFRTAHPIHHERELQLEKMEDENTILTSGPYDFESLLQFGVSRLTAMNEKKSVAASINAFLGMAFDPHTRIEPLASFKTGPSSTALPDAASSPQEPSPRVAGIEVSSQGKPILYIHLDTFAQRSLSGRTPICDALKSTLQYKVTHFPHAGLILDLRSNPGGQLHEAQCVTSLFLRPDLPLVSFRPLQTHPNSIRPKSTSNQGFRYDKPVAVLIGPGTASAAEMVAGALQYHRRAVLVGERSFGKGTMQTATDNQRPLRGVRFWQTKAVYVFPDGRSPQVTGLEPDFVVHQQYQVQEVDLVQPREENRYRFPIPAVGASRRRPDNALTPTIANCVERNGEAKKIMQQRPLEDYPYLVAKDALLCMAALP
jgi:hypothetical protein